MVLKPLFEQSALLLKRGRKKVVVLADLHIGLELELEDRGIRVPMQIDAIRSRLEAIIEDESPDMILIAGDLKHTVTGLRFREARAIRDLLGFLDREGVDYALVRGNHDSQIWEIVPEDKIKTLLPIFDVLIAHGHTKIDLGDFRRKKRVIIGHIHPAIQLRDELGKSYLEKIWMRIPIDERRLRESLGVDRVNIKEIIVLPAFSPFIIGLPVNDPQTSLRDLSPVVRLDAVDLEGSEIFRIDGLLLGTLSQVAEPEIA